MVIKEVGVLVLATLTALAAGGGVLQLGAHAMAPTPYHGQIAKAADGHFWAAADVDGRAIRFLVDTGSSAVTLTADDAAKLGIDVSRLRFDRPVFTAAGNQSAAAVVLGHIDVAGARVDGVKALVMRGGLSTSLLGMSYLGRLSRIEATPDRLVLSR